MQLVIYTTSAAIVMHEQLATYYVTEPAPRLVHVGPNALTPAKVIVT